jgi:hypothetical protein
MTTSCLRKTAFVLGLLGATFAASESRASDHIDGLKTALDNSADLTDLFVFVAPEDPTKLVLIMDVNTLASGISEFSDAVNYSFRIRPVDPTSLTPSSDPTQEVSIVCTFAGGTPLIDPTQTATCTFNFVDGPESLSFSTRAGNYQAGGDGQTNDVRAFAGVRSDPWFLDLAKTLAVNQGLSMTSLPGVDGLWGQNVLSIVVVVPQSRLPGTLLAATAQTVRP